jgi:GNAT superfamily N-acetyltransferase
LVDAVLAAMPGAIADIELSATLENVRLDAMAQGRGFDRSEPNYVLTLALDGDRSEYGDDEVTDATAEHVGWITPLHESEFPSTYASPHQLLEGNYELLVVPGGYAAGRVTPDGEGYIDFVAVEEAARGAGLGPRLVRALVARLEQAGARKQVSLTVQEHREGARRMYAALGFQVEIVIIGYRKKP